MNFGCFNAYKGEYDSLSLGDNGLSHFYGSNANVLVDRSFYVPPSFTMAPAERFNPTMDISIDCNKARSMAMANLNQSFSSSSTILPSLMTYNAALLPGLDPDRCRFLYDHGAGASDKSVPVKNNGDKAGKKSNVVKKGHWTAEEDRLLISLVEKYGVLKWFQIAQMLGGRVGKQCRDRWHNHLRPDIKKDKWSEEEDRILIEAHSEIGNKWAEIAKRIPGRTENSIKNHWNATKRRQLSQKRRRRSSKHPDPSLLQEYIKSLDTAVATPSPEVLPAASNSRSDVAANDIYDAAQLLEEFGHGGGTVDGSTVENGWTMMEQRDGTTPVAPVMSWESAREMDLIEMTQNFVI